MADKIDPLFWLQTPPHILDILLGEGDFPKQPMLSSDPQPTFFDDAYFGVDQSLMHTIGRPYQQEYAIPFPDFTCTPVPVEASVTSSSSRPSPSLDGDFPRTAHTPEHSYVQCPVPQHFSAVPGFSDYMAGLMASVSSTPSTSPGRRIDGPQRRHGPYHTQNQVIALPEAYEHHEMGVSSNILPPTLPGQTISKRGVIGRGSRERSLTTSSRGRSLSTPERCPTPERPFGCHMCSLRFSRRRDRDRHERSVHTRYSMYRCDGCGMGFVRTDARGRHWKSHPECVPAHEKASLPQIKSGSWSELERD